MTRIIVEFVLVVAAYVAGVLTHKWIVARAQKLVSQAADVTKGL